MIKHISLTNKNTRIKKNIATLMKVIRAFDNNNGPTFWKTPESRHEKEETVYWCNCRGRNIYRSEILVRMKSRILWMSREWNVSRTHNFYIKDYNVWDESPFDPDDFEFKFTGDFLDACKLIMDIKTIQDEYYGI